MTGGSRKVHYEAVGSTVQQHPEMFKKAVDTVHEAVPHSTVVVLPGQQHVAMNTNPEVFLREVVRFLSE